MYCNGNTIILKFEESLKIKNRAITVATSSALPLDAASSASHL